MQNSRNPALAHFLQTAGWSAAKVTPLAGDASARQYFRLNLDGKMSVVMDAPLGQPDDPATFVAVAEFLQSRGLSAPTVLAQDLQRGFLLLEDLGDALFVHETARDPKCEQPLYKSAASVLAHVQKTTPGFKVENFSAAQWAASSELLISLYGAEFGSEAAVASDFVAILTDILEKHADSERVFILRDYHSENLLWLPQRQGLKRVGLLDFQLGQLGQPAYDLVSLLQDARRDVLPATRDESITHFLNLSGHAHADFMASFAAFGAQRAARILGLFTRLALMGKPRYIKLMPRVWRQLNENLAHPALLPLQNFCAKIVPVPTPERLQCFETKCPKTP